jgi:hypothetical protein
MARPQTPGMSARLEQTPAASYAAAVLLLVLLGGCTPLDLSRTVWLPGLAPKPVVPQTMADFWTEYLHREQGHPAVRGFGGRVMFYGQKAGEPVLVDGTLTVYAYDDSRGEPNEKKPDKKYVFTREQLAQHYSKSELGHSYSFWLPWDETGGEEKRVTLITRFDDASGRAVMGKPTKQTLFGTRPASDKVAGQSSDVREASAKTAGDQNIRQMSYEEASGPKNPAPADGSTELGTTINLPPSFVRRFRAAIDAAAEAQQQGTADGTQPVPPATSPAGNDPTAKAPAPAGTQPATEAPPEARSAHARFPVQRARTARPTSAHVRTLPYPAMWPTSLPRSPSTDQPSEWTASTPTAPAAQN